MLKNWASYLIDKTYKDPQIATNTCSTDSNFANKYSMNKFTRKQDVSRIQKKKKHQNQQPSLMCYLTPKNCQQSAKLIKQKIKDNSSQLGINSFISYPTPQATPKNASGKLSFKGYQQSNLSNRVTSIQKPYMAMQSQNKIITVSARSKKQSADKSKLMNEQFGNVKDKDYSKSFKLSDIRRLQQKQGEKQQNDSKNKNKLMPLSYQKQLKKLKNQCQHYSNLLQISNKQRLQSQTQIKSLNSLINELKTKNNHLTKSNDQLSKQILQLNTKFNSINQQNQKIKKQNITINEEKNKFIEETNYLKDNINELNQRIQVMLESQQQYRNNKPLNFITSSSKQLTNGRRFNSMSLVAPQIDKFQRQIPTDEESKAIHQLKDQLKYCQVQINMLKRVKMDINKKNQEFIKLQRQNRILKNQIFDMKTSNIIEDQVNNCKSANRLPLNNNKLSSNVPLNRNNFQISLQRGARGKDCDKSESRSSDTLSLNLSVSPQKQRRRA